MSTTPTLPPPLPEVQLSAGSWTVDHYLPRPGLHGRPGYDPFILDAPYQRGSVWTVDQRRALIRSFIQGLPVGAVIIADIGVTQVAGYRIVDGKQRIEAIRAWVTDGFDVPGWWFSARWLADGETARASDVRYSDLSEYGQRSTYRWSLPGMTCDSTKEWLDVGEGNGDHGNGRRYKITHRTRAEMLAYEAQLYALVNGGGTPQTAADMANAARIAAAPVAVAKRTRCACGYEGTVAAVQAHQAEHAEPEGEEV